MSADNQKIPEKLHEICSRLNIEYYGIANTPDGSAAVFLFPYYTGIPCGNLSLYAAVCDYHLVIKKYLTRIGDFIGVPYTCHTDVSPYDEVRLAYCAGLGFLGRNGLIINEKYGSYVFIGEIVFCGIYLDENKEPKGECLQCGLCEKKCPADAVHCKSRCISEISQKKGELTAEETEFLKKGSLIWGCDICSNICPMNKNIETTNIPEFKNAVKQSLYKSEVDGLSAKQFKRKFPDRAFTWRGSKVLLRNIDIMEAADMKTEKSCGAVIFKRENGECLVLVIKHKKQGHFSFPKGHVEGSETEEETAKREIFEETGLEVSLDTGFRYIVTYSPKKGVMKDVIYFTASPVGGSLKPQPEEVSEVKWISVKNAFDTVTFENDRNLLSAAVKYMNTSADII